MEAKKMFDKFFAKKSFSKWVLVFGIIGMVLIAVSSFLPASDGNEGETSENITSDDVREYTNQLEEKVTNLVSLIDGVGNCSVMITLENGVENVYANSEKNSDDSTDNISGNGERKTTEKKDSEQNVVVVDGSDGKQALTVTQKEPTVKGVVVVCDGADNPAVVQRVTDAVTTALNIKSNRVSVVKAATNNVN